MDENKKGGGGAEEDKATAEGDLEVTSKDLDDAEKTLKDVSMECMTQAETTDVSKKSREEEIAVINKAMKILQSMTGGATERSYGFVQVESSTTLHSKLQTRKDLVGLEAVNVVRKL